MCDLAEWDPQFINDASEIAVAAVIGDDDDDQTSLEVEPRRREIRHLQNGPANILN